MLDFILQDMKLEMHGNGQVRFMVLNVLIVGAALKMMVAISQHHLVSLLLLPLLVPTQDSEL